MQILNYFLDAVAGVFRTLATLCLGTMLAINAVNIVWRAVTNQAFDWVFSWTILLFVWMLFLGLFVYMRDRRDVTVDIIVLRFPPLLRKIIGVCGSIIGLLVMALILKSAPALMALQIGRMEAIDLPIYLRALPLFISAGLICLHFILNAIEIATGKRQAFARAETEPDILTEKDTSK